MLRFLFLVLSSAVPLMMARAPDSDSRLWLDGQFWGSELTQYPQTSWVAQPFVSAPTKPHSPFAPPHFNYELQFALAPFASGVTESPLAYPGKSLIGDTQTHHSVVEHNNHSFVTDPETKTCFDPTYNEPRANPSLPSDPLEEDFQPHVHKQIHADGSRVYGYRQMRGVKYVRFFNFTPNRESSNILC